MKIFIISSIIIDSNNTRRNVPTPFRFNLVLLPKNAKIKNIIEVIKKIQIILVNS